LVACFCTLDPRKNGFIDFDQLFNYMKKYNHTINTSEVNAVLRRLNNDENFKIDFREFCQNMSPLMPGYTPEACITPE